MSSDKAATAEEDAEENKAWRSLAAGEIFFKKKKKRRYFTRKYSVKRASRAWGNFLLLPFFAGTSERVGGEERKTLFLLREMIETGCAGKLFKGGELAK